MADKLTNSLVAKAKKENDLSPNPSGFGFTKQVKVDSLPVSGQEFDTLYYLPDGRAFRWSKEHKWERVLNDGQPSVKSKNGQAAPNTKVETPATPAFAKIINGNVAVNGRLLVNGKDVETDDTEEEIIKVIDTVNEGLVDGTINVVANGEGTASTPLAKIKVGENIYDVLDLEKLAGVEAGSAASLLGVDSSGNVVKGDVPVGSVIDDNVTSDGINPVKGSGIYSFVEGIVAEEYDSTDTYNTGDYCLYQGGLYIAKADSVTGSWDSSKWDLVAISEKLKELKEEVDKKADTTALEDGGIVPAKSLTSKQLENVSEDSGSTQDAPFVFQATATDGGAGASDTAPTAKYLKLKGKTYAFNQLVNHGNFDATTGWTTNVGINLTVSNNIGTLTYSSENASANMSRAVSLINGHKYLFKLTFKPSAATTLTRIAFYSSDFATQIAYQDFGSISEKTNLSGIITSNRTDATARLIIYPSLTTSMSVGATIELENCQLIDLTQLVNGNSDELDLFTNGVTLSDYDLTFTGVDLFNQLFPLPYYAYNAGALVSANATLLTTYGKNQFDGEIEGGGFNQTTGEEKDLSDNCRSVNFINVIPSQKYTLSFNKTTYTSTSSYILEYDANYNFIKVTSIYNNELSVTLTNNTHYVRLMLYKGSSGWGTTPPLQSSIQICFYLYWDGTRTGYEAYTKHEYPLGSELATSPLLSAGSICDEKTPDGTITRRVGVVDLGTLSWSYRSNNGTFRATVSNIKINGYNVMPNILCSLYKKINSYYGNDDVSADKTITTWSSLTSILIQDSAYTDADTFKTAMSGVYLYYELDTPTTEVGTPFAAVVEVDDFGTMEYGGSSYNGYPQGCEFFYPADYVLFIDSLGNACDFDPSKIALKSDVNTAIATFITSITGYDATKVQTLKNNEGTLQWVDDE